MERKWGIPFLPDPKIYRQSHLIDTGKIYWEFIPWLPVSDRSRIRYMKYGGMDTSLVLGLPSKANPGSKFISKYSLWYLKLIVL